MVEIDELNDEDEALFARLDAVFDDLCDLDLTSLTDDDLLELLVAIREAHLRMAAVAHALNVAGVGRLIARARSAEQLAEREAGGVSAKRTRSPREPSRHRRSARRRHHRKSR
jgi:hypothetical protein